MTDAARVFDGITPENVIDPPACTPAEAIRNHPRQAAARTLGNLWDAVRERTHRMRVWDSLSTTGQWALESAHDAVPCRLAGSTRAALARRGLIQPGGGITLLGREVVYEARRGDQITRRIACRHLAGHPEQAARLGVPAGCCTARLGPVRCSCSCHQLRRCTTVSAPGRAADPKVQAYEAVCAEAWRAAARLAPGPRDQDGGAQ